MVDGEGIGRPEASRVTAKAHRSRKMKDEQRIINVNGRKSIVTSEEVDARSNVVEEIRHVT
jgi:hypothetical protein